MEKNNKKIPFINYVKLFILVLITVLICFGFRKFYINKTNYELNISIIGQYLNNSVNGEEIYNYVRENEDSFVYIGVVSDGDCRSFEEKFKDVIIDNEYNDKITYLNISNESSRKKFIKEFNKFYGTKLLGVPSIVVFKEGEVVDIYSVKSGSLDVSTATLFLKDNGIDNSDL